MCVVVVLRLTCLTISCVCVCAILHEKHFLNSRQQCDLNDDGALINLLHPNNPHKQQKQCEHKSTEEKKSTYPRLKLPIEKNYRFAWQALREVFTIFGPIYAVIPVKCGPTFFRILPVVKHLHTYTHLYITYIIMFLPLIMAKWVWFCAMRVRVCYATWTFCTHSHARKWIFVNKNHCKRHFIRSFD